jgi:hypothetical protein
MSAEHKQILRRFFHDVLERGDVGVLDSIVDRAFVDHQRRRARDLASTASGSSSPPFGPA